MIKAKITLINNREVFLKFRSDSNFDDFITAVSSRTNRLRAYEEFVRQAPGPLIWLRTSDVITVAVADNA